MKMATNTELIVQFRSKKSKTFQEAKEEEELATFAPLNTKILLNLYILLIKRNFLRTNENFYKLK